MISTFSKMLDLLSPREKRRFYLLLVLVMVTGLVEMVGVASILPFLAVLANPETIETNAFLSRVYDLLNFSGPQAFIVFLGVSVLAFIVFGLCVKLVTAYSIARFSSMRAYSLSSRLVENYLNQPYIWFLNRNSAELGKIILNEVDRVVTGVIVPAMKLLSRVAIVLSILGLLIFLNPEAAIFAALLFGGSYAVIFLGVKNTLSRLGHVLVMGNYERFKIAQESMGGIKEVKVLGVEDSFLRMFREPSRRIARAKAVAAVIGEVPRHILEAVAVGGAIALVLYLLADGSKSLNDIIPTLGVFAFAGVRMFPALQAVYTLLTSIRTARPALDQLHTDMMETRFRPAYYDSRRDPRTLPLRRTLEIVDVCYAYPGSEQPALRDLNLTIAANTTVGFVGGTGAGKTTTVDLVLGLLTPQQGALQIDGVPLAESNLRAWQRNIGYVPQQIFLIDDTVTANIAFGIPAEQIDRAAVERAARVAELHDFVTRELPHGYETRVGDRGVRLSGGQRQRIGIARALYHDPDVLIMDEATSALDNLTERAVMDAVHNLGRAKTIIMIAHRLSTVRECDNIFMMEHGRVIASGPYDVLIGNSREFRALAELAS